MRHSSLWTVAALVAGLSTSAHGAANCESDREVLMRLLDCYGDMLEEYVCSGIPPAEFSDVIVSECVDARNHAAICLRSNGMEKDAIYRSLDELEAMARGTYTKVFYDVRRPACPPL